MIATPVIGHRSLVSGPRPINLNRDARQVLSLMELAFGPILGSQGQRISGDRLALSYHDPFLMRFNMVARGFIPGFVWDEEGQIIGNVSLVDSKAPGRYLIANVAVHPEHRRQGIARTLMDKSIQHVIERGGREIFLQVETDNQAAKDLYRSLDFAAIGDISHWDSTTSRVRALPLMGQDEPDIRPLSGRYWRAAYQLDVASVDPNLIWPAPPAPDFYKTGWWRAANNFLNGQKMESWAVTEADPNNERRRMLAGLVTVESAWGRPHKLTLRVAPQRKGGLERPLLAKVMRRLRYLRGGTVQIIHPAGDQLVSQLLNEANFQVRRNLTVMQLKLK